MKQSILKNDSNYECFSFVKDKGQKEYTGEITDQHKCTKIKKQVDMM